jgi:hypothetical protein
MAGNLRSKTFAVPGGAGVYAPEILYLAQDENHPQSDDVSEVTLFIESLPATAVVEVDLLQPGGVETVAVDWIVAAQSHNAIGLKAVLQLANWRGVRVRAKSGGTAGSAVVHASWW